MVGSTIFLWDAVRAYVDRTTQKGQIILTGSSTPISKGIFHSGVGRIKKIKMNTMSLYESNDSTGVVSLRDLYNGIFKTEITSEIRLEELAYLIVRGGWPGNLNTDKENCGEVAINYIDVLLDEDLHKIDSDIEYDSKKAKLNLKSLARNESTTVSNQTILNDIIENDKESISKNTLVKYLNAFNRLFILNNQEPFSTNIRSSIRVK